MPDADPLDAVATAGCSDALIRSRARSAYLRLRDQIVRGDLPPLRQLKVMPLCGQLGVNSSAVREALSRLTAEHLVEARDQQGFRVAPLSLEELDDLARTWIDIESIMLRRAIEAGDATWECRVRAAHRAVSVERSGLSDDRIAALHDEFHDALLSGCDSPTMHRIRDSLVLQSERYRAFAVESAGITWPVPDARDEVAPAALARDADRAVAALARHIAETGKILRNAFIKVTGISPYETPCCRKSG